MTIPSLPHFCGLLVFLGWSLGAAPAEARAPRGTASSAAETAAGLHVVGPKDTLFGLARQYGTTVDKIKAANGLRGNLLRDGQKLRIPGAGTAEAADEPLAAPDHAPEIAPEDELETEPQPQPQPQPVATPTTPAAASHVVQKGDTLFGIAKKYGVTVKALKKANGLRGDAISRGQQLRLPGGEAPKEEGILKKTGRAVKEGVSGIFGGDGETVETREVIPTEASIGKTAGQGKPAPAAPVDEILATYLVTPYDNLEKIAQDFNTTPVRLMQLNKMDSAADLRTKKHIYVPGNGLQAKWSKAY